MRCRVSRCVLSICAAMAESTDFSPRPSVGSARRPAGPGFRSNRARGALPDSALDLLLGLGDQPRHLPRKLRRKRRRHGQSGRTRTLSSTGCRLRGCAEHSGVVQSAFVLANFRGSEGAEISSLNRIRGRETNRRRKSDTPNVPADFEFHTNLKQFPDRPRALNPSDATPDSARRGRVHCEALPA